MANRRLWIALVVVIGGSFAVLGYYGSEIYRQAPPVPEQVVTTDGKVLFTGRDIRDGQNVWHSMGGQAPPINILRWLRVIGASIFAIGVISLGWFVLGLKTGWSLEAENDEVLTGSTSLLPKQA